MRAEYKRDVNHNYLILQNDVSTDTASYPVRMLTGNVIPSVLKCRLQGLDGQELFYYDITSRQSVASFYEQKKFSGEDLEMILGGFVRVVEDMAEYLLNPEQLLLMPEYMYLDISRKEVKFCCLPGYNRPIQEQFREFTEYCLPKLAHEDAQAVRLGYGVYRKALETGFHLESIKKVLYQDQVEEETEREEDYEAEIEKAEEAEEQEDIFQELSQETLEPEEKQQAQKVKSSDWKWIISCGAGVLVLLGILIASLLGYLPGISAEYVMAAMILLVGTGAGATWISEKKRKKQEASAQWREKVKKELEKQDTVLTKSEEEMPVSVENEQKKYTGTLSVTEEDYGETVVLSAGITSGPPSLVSREPGELPAIYLEQDLIVIGKMETAADVVLPVSTVSRVHARIRKKQDGFYLADLNSRNGTSVNGRMLKPEEEYLLQDEDQVDFAQARYIFLK